MRISEANGREGIELLGEVLDNIINVITDRNVYANLYCGGSTQHAIKYAFRDHTDDSYQILLKCNGKTEDDYKEDPFSAAQDLIEILTDEPLLSFFGSQDHTKTKKSVKRTGPAMENIKATETK